MFLRMAAFKLFINNKQCSSHTHEINHHHKLIITITSGIELLRQLPYQWIMLPKQMTWNPLGLYKYHDGYHCVLFLRQNLVPCHLIAVVGQF